jgi:hypothetical protein
VNRLRIRAFAYDSPLEGGGFEPSVPRKRDSVFSMRTGPDPAGNLTSGAACAATKRALVEPHSLGKKPSPPADPNSFRL